MLKQTYNARLAESVWWNLLLLTVGGIMLAACLQGVAKPQGFMTGGFMGVALLVDNMTGGILPVSAWYLLVSLPVFVWGFFFVGKVFLLYTAYGTLVTSVMGLVFNHFHFVLAVENELYAAIFGGVVMGAGCGIMMRSLGANGGLSVIAVALRRRWNVAVGQFSFLFNAVLFLGAAFFGTPLDKIIVSLIMVFLSSSVLDYVLGLFNQRKMVFIISEKGEAIGEAIRTTLGFGSTLLCGKGPYSGSARQILLSVTSNIVLKRMETLVYSIDPHAFFVVENTFFVRGGQFSQPAK